ncbi:hypothetical protein acdb102_23600 [Acidothermaceae bacterium B102]|nr:hypothetical protein acdb102_23600 [Acidothermaceae bacterium B102]
MGTWTVDPGRRPGVLWLEIKGTLNVEEAKALVAGHRAAVDGFLGRDYAVFCDLREMKVLSGEAAAVYEQAKVYSAAHPNFRGSSVLVASTVVALQHQRTSASGGVTATELVGTDEAELWRHVTALLSP